MTFISKREMDGKNITITIRFISEVPQSDKLVIQFVNVMMKRCFDYIKLRRVGRNFYDIDHTVTTIISIHV